MFNDPELVKLLIYGLGGACAVLLLAVLILAFKRNIYYVDENGLEIEKAAAKAKLKREKAKKKGKEIVEEVEEEVEEEPIVEEEIEKTAVFKTVQQEEPVKEIVPEIKEEAPINQTLQVPIMRHVEPKIKGA